MMDIVDPFAPGTNWQDNGGEGLRSDVFEEVNMSRKAGFWVRTIAFLIDNMILNLIYMIFLVSGGLAVYLASGASEPLMFLGRAAGLTTPCNLIMVVITIGYFTYLHGATGQTIGKMVCRLKVVREDGEPLSYGRSFLRCTGYIFSAIVLNLGFLWVAFDRNKQGWHDKIARTYVIRLSKKRP